MGSSNVNGGYSKTIKRFYMLDMRTANNSSCCEIIHASSRREAIARAFSNGKGHYVRIGDHPQSVRVEGENMSPVDLEQCREWMVQPKVPNHFAGYVSSMNENGWTP